MVQKKTASKPEVAEQAKSVPAKLPLELIPFYLWWREQGGRFLANVLTALVVFGAVFGGYGWWTGRNVDANKAFMEARSFVDLEEVVSSYGSTKIGNAARLRLAKAYFDAGKYEEALEAYDACLAKGAPMGFAEVAQMGRACSLEATGQLDEAAAAYSAFEAENPEHFLVAEARMGRARVLTLQGQKEEAKRVLEVLKAEHTDEPMLEMAVSRLEGVIDRYEPRAARSLFDRADEAARELPALGVPATGMP